MICHGLVPCTTLWFYLCSLHTTLANNHGKWFPFKLLICWIVSCRFLLHNTRPICKFLTITSPTDLKCTCISMFLNSYHHIATFPSLDSCNSPCQTLLLAYKAQSRNVNTAVLLHVLQFVSCSFYSTLFATQVAAFFCTVSCGAFEANPDNHTWIPVALF